MTKKDILKITKEFMNGQYRYMSREDRIACIQIRKDNLFYTIEEINND